MRTQVQTNIYTMSDGDNEDLDRTPAIAIGGGGTRTSSSRKSAEAAASFISDDDDLDYIPPISGRRQRLSEAQAVQEPPHSPPPPSSTATTPSPSSSLQIPETDCDEPDDGNDGNDGGGNDELAAAAAAKDAGLKPEVRTVPHPSGSGLRIVMTDASSDDEVLAKWKRRREAQRATKGGGHNKGQKSRGEKMKKRAGGAPTDPAAGASKRPKLVGQAAMRTQTQTRAQTQPQQWQFSEDDEDEGAGAARNEGRRMPTYLLGRKEWLERAKKGVRKAADAEAVFRVPPSYEGIDFSDDERLVSRTEAGGIRKRRDRLM